MRPYRIASPRGGTRDDAEGLGGPGLRDAGQQPLAGGAHHLFHLGDGLLAEGREVDGLGAAVGVLQPVDVAGRLQHVEQAHDRGAVEGERGGQVLLAQRLGCARDVQQREPGGLRQAQRLQLLVEDAAPLAGGLAHQGHDGFADAVGARGHGWGWH